MLWRFRASHSCTLSFQIINQEQCYSNFRFLKNNENCGLKTTLKKCYILVFGSKKAIAIVNSFLCALKNGKSLGYQKAIKSLKLYIRVNCIPWETLHVCKAVNLLVIFWFLFWGYFLGSYFLEKNFKIILLINVQTVHRQMNQPQEEEIRLTNYVWGSAGCPTH